MSLTSPTFFAFLAATIVAFHLSASVTYRRFVLGTANAVFIGSYLSEVREVLPLLAFLLLGYACVVLVHLRRSGVILGIGVVAVLVSFIFLKRFSFFEPLGSLPFPYLLVGLSYILFRILHVMIDVRSGDLDGLVGPFAFFRYTCNFLSFVSGPIQRYQDFSATDGVQQAPLDADKVYSAFSRVATGYVKFVVIAATAEYAFSFLNQHLAEAAGAKLVVLYAAAASAYLIHLYFNFSGYMDIVIGAGHLLGQTLPENFDKPFVSRSFLEFWQRWHMTLSQWFKFYLFNPLLMLLMTLFPAPALTAYLGVVVFFVTFLVMGVWHGTTAVFVVYGLLMGLGASVNKIWQVVCTERLGKKGYRSLTEKVWYIYGARGVTMAYFLVAFTCLWTPELQQLMSLVHRLGVVGLGSAFVMLVVLFALAALVMAGVGKRVSGVSIAAIGEGLVARNVVLAGKIMSVIAIATLFHKAPDFVYKAF
ncbi:MBOAT family O-acyltransferase [Bradyrhizobium sp. UFLA05-153]